MFRFLTSARNRRSHGTCAWTPVLIFILIPALTVIFTFPASAQEPGSPHDKKLDIHSSAGEVHLGNDADASKIGLPAYPGARLRHENEGNSNAANLGVSLDSFGIKLVIARYDSDDTPAKVIAYYRERLKKYGTVVECHTHEHGGHVNGDADNHDDRESKELKCEGDSSGPVTELKVGTEDNQHVVAVEPGESGSGSTFALVYLHVRGKRGEI
jgi:hypothetical protein